jgi:hypothetical protein
MLDKVDLLIIERAAKVAAGRRRRDLAIRWSVVGVLDWPNTKTERHFVPDSWCPGVASSQQGCKFRIKNKSSSLWFGRVSDIDKAHTAHSI